MDRIEPIVMMALTAISTLVDEKAGELGDHLGAQFKAAVQNTDTQLDDYAMARVATFLTRAAKAMQ